MTRSTESLFIYRSKLNHDFYNNPDFEPIFQPGSTPPDSNVTILSVTSAARDVCGGNVFCQYDHDVTKDEAVASATLHAHEWSHSVKTSATPGKNSPCL